MLNFVFYLVRIVNCVISFLTEFKLALLYSRCVTEDTLIL